MRSLRVQSLAQFVRVYLPGRDALFQAEGGSEAGGFAEGAAVLLDADGGLGGEGGRKAATSDEQVFKADGQQAAVGDFVVVTRRQVLHHQAAFGLRTVDVNRIGVTGDGIREAGFGEVVFFRERIIADDAPGLANADHWGDGADVRRLEAFDKNLKETGDAAYLLPADGLRLG